MDKKTNSKLYDLEERTLEFAKRIIRLCRSLPKDTVNIELAGQCVRSGTSIGANYREANESETKKDFKFKIRICLRESKETVYWLKLIIHANPKLENISQDLLRENQELVKIFASILEKCRTV